MSMHLLYNYILTTLNIIRKQPVFSAIKILSLTLGLVCALLVLAHVQFIYSYDKHFPNWQNIYRVVTSTTRDYNQTADPYAQALAQDYGQIEHIARLRPDSAAFSRTNVSSSEASPNPFFWVDPSIIELFSFEFVQGGGASALDEINTIVINETTAQKYFGDENPVGQSLTFDNRVDLQVTGVMRDLPVNSYLQIQAMISISTAQQIIAPTFMNGNGWTNFAGTQTYLSVASSADATAIASDLDNFIDRNIADASREYAERVNLTLALEPLSEVYLSRLTGFSSDAYDSGGPVRARVFYGLIVFAILILFTSCINYANLSASQVQQRSKEIGVRKAIGANQGQIVVQFLLESIMLTMIALSLSVPIIQALVPVYTNLTDTAFTAEDIVRIDRLIGPSLLVLVTGLLSGLLPALASSTIQPINLAKGSGVGGMVSRALRSAMTVFQFSLSGTLVILAIAIVLLIEHLDQLEIGFNRQDLVVLDHGFTLAQRRAEYELWETRNSALNNELAQHSAILSVAESTVAPPATGWGNRWRRDHWPEDSSKMTYNIGVDESYLDTMQLDLIAGRGFSQDFPADFVSGVQSRPENVYGAIVTRSALDHFEFDSPDAALGEILKWGNNRTYRIVGVVEDFKFSGGLEDSADSTSVLWATNQPGFYSILRIDPAQTEAALEHIDSVWAKHRDGNPINRRFYEQTYDQLIYERTNGVNKASQFAAIITISIAVMGLYALAVYSTQRRTKEVGIRKTLGATTESLIRLFTWDFVKPVVAACLISWLGGYLAVSYLFSQFSSFPVYSISYYVLVASGTLLLAISTVSLQCFRAANSNPVESLRFE